MKFRAVNEPEPGPKWAAHFAAAWPEYRAWFLAEGDSKRPPYLSCRGALERHLPELVPTWEALTALGGGGDEVARLLSLHCPAPYLIACSQLAWSGDEPLLVRNYDYHPDRCEGLLLHSAWRGTRVIASIDCLWGALDGINEHGVAVSLAFGGRKVVGEGFGIPLLLRAALELAHSTREAVDILCRLPCHMAYNVTVLDAAGDAATVWLNPDRAPVVAPAPLSTNHQGQIEWPEHDAATRSRERAEVLAAQLGRPASDAELVLAAFLQPPLYRPPEDRAYGTLYTAIYRPRARRVDFVWPWRWWTQSFEHFVEGEVRVGP